MTSSSVGPAKGDRYTAPEDVRIRIWTIRELWAQLLARHRWQCVMTLTFDRSQYVMRLSQSPERADKAFRRLVRHANEVLYGRRWMSRARCGGVVWALAKEAHKDGSIHFHVLFDAPSRAMTKETIQELGNWWRNHFGFARSEAPESNLAVINYLVKHAGDGDAVELDISFNFDNVERNSR